MMRSFLNRLRQHRLPSCRSILGNGLSFVSVCDRSLRFSDCGIAPGTPNKICTKRLDPATIGGLHGIPTRFAEHGP